MATLEAMGSFTWLGRCWRLVAFGTPTCIRVWCSCLHFLHLCEDLHCFTKWPGNWNTDHSSSKWLVYHRKISPWTSGMHRVDDILSMILIPGFCWSYPYSTSIYRSHLEKLTLSQKVSGLHSAMQKCLKREQTSHERTGLHNDKMQELDMLTVQ